MATAVKMRINGKLIALTIVSAILIMILYNRNNLTSYYTEKNSKVYYFYDEYENKIPIPNGFELLDQKINQNDGIVIVDNTKSETVGNEFVWVPCDTFQRINYMYSKLAYKNYNMNFVDEKEYTALLKSVEKYKGFYIGRYEASKSDKYIDDVQIAASVKNKMPWVEIQYATNMNDIYGYSKGALKTAKYTYKQHGNINSTIMYPEHIDNIIKWFLEFGELKTNAGGKVNKKDIIEDSHKIGNYSGKINLTGSNKNFCIKNICDLAGNVAEITTESYYGNYHIIRGQKSLVYKRNLDAYTIHDWVGFRLVLII